jgi:hypothetical protein
MKSLDVAATSDRINLTGRNAVMLVSSIAKANNKNIADSPFSKSTLKRKRSHFRSQIESKIKNLFFDTKKACIPF